MGRAKQRHGLKCPPHTLQLMSILGLRVIYLSLTLLTNGYFVELRPNDSVPVGLRPSGPLRRERAQKAGRSVSRTCISYHFHVILMEF